MSGFYGLIGEKLGHSISPLVHGIILKKLNLSGAYNLFEVKRKNLSAAVEGLKVLGCSGANVTIPYKIDIMRYLDKTAPEAEKIGAVNTIEFTSDGLIGHNTDYYGFGRMLKKSGIDPAGKSVVILGTGGVSKAVFEYLVANEAKEVIFASQNPQNASKGMGKNKVISYDELKTIEGKDLIINCTPCGMYPDEKNSPVSMETIAKFRIAVDLIYNPVNTLFLDFAKKSNLITADGLYMLIAQAAASQEIWHGIKLDDKFIEELYEEVRLKYISLQKN